MPDEMMTFNHVTGSTATISWEARQQHLVACEAALQRIWEVSGCFRTEHAEPVLVGCHEIAHEVLHPDPPACKRPCPVCGGDDSDCLDCD